MNIVIITYFGKELNMQFIKNFFKHDSVIGLCGVKKKTEYVYIEVPKSYKKTFLPNTENNYLLI